MERIRTADLADELSTLLSQVAGRWSCSDVMPVSEEQLVSARVGISFVDGRYESWVRSDSERVVLTCSEDSVVADEDVGLLRKIIAVFNYDLAIVGDTMEAREIWVALAQTRFLRAASRLSNISTEHLVRRIRVFEAAARQTYEGAPFVGSVVMAHSLETFRAYAGDRFRPFTTTVTFERALLHEKWLKPFLEGGDFALVTTSYRGNARGFTDASLAWPSPVQSAPVGRLEGLYGYLRPGTSVLSASPSGDIYFALPTGATFRSSKGQWRYQNWTPLRTVLSRHCDDDAVDGVVRLVRSSSYEHRGALYVVLQADADATQVVPDHQVEGRPTQTLRATLAGVEISDPTTVNLVGVASRIDGAVVFDRKGHVVDVASMVSEPSTQALANAGHSQLMRFSGARTTAAWNASIHGLAIKVSDDGPVDVYEAGQLVFHAD